MKTLYDMLAIALGIILFFTLIPLIMIVIQIALVLLFALCEIMLLPICIAVVYMAWQKAKQNTEN